MIRPWLGMLMKGRALASAASLVVLPASIRPAPWQAAGCRRYRLMRDHLSPVPKSLLANVVQMPEVSHVHECDAMPRVVRTGACQNWRVCTNACRRHTCKCCICHSVSSMLFFFKKNFVFSDLASLTWRVSGVATPLRETGDRRAQIFC